MINVGPLKKTRLGWAWHRFWVLKPWRRSNAKKVAKALQEAAPRLTGKVTHEGLEKARELLWGRN